MLTIARVGDAPKVRGPGMVWVSLFPQFTWTVSEVAYSAARWKDLTVQRASSRVLKGRSLLPRREPCSGPIDRKLEGSLERVEQLLSKLMASTNEA